MVNYEPETRTDIEQLYSERIAAFNIALNERIEKFESSFDKKQLDILRAKNEFLEMENFMDRKRTKSTYRRNQELVQENARLKQKIILIDNQ